MIVIIVREVVFMCSTYNPNIINKKSSKVVNVFNFFILIFMFLFAGMLYGEEHTKAADTYTKKSFDEASYSKTQIYLQLNGVRSGKWEVLICSTDEKYYCNVGHQIPGTVAGGPLEITINRHSSGIESGFYILMLDGTTEDTGYIKDLAADLPFNYHLGFNFVIRNTYTTCNTINCVSVSTHTVDYYYRVWWHN